MIGLARLPGKSTLAAAPFGKDLFRYGPAFRPSA
jgi:hypothetical protein